MTSKQRLRSLDILRCVAVILVLGRHMDACPPGSPYPVDALLTMWKQVGWIGVDLFFVLSGFLVSGLLFAEYQRKESLDVRRFLIRRGLKIYPAFYLLFAVTLLMMRFEGTSIDPLAALSEGLFLQSYLPRFWNHTWTLAVEEHFYLAIAGVIAWMVARGHGRLNPFGRLVPLAIVIAVTTLTLRCLNHATAAYSHSTHLMPTHLRFDSLMLGVLSAYGYHFHGESVREFATIRRRELFMFAALMIGPAFVFPLGSNWVMHTVGFTLLAVGFAALLLACVDWQPSVPIWADRLGAVLAACGVYSYSIYLWHMPVHVYGSGVVKGLVGTRGGHFGGLMIYLVGSVFVGIVMSKLVEYPVLKWRDRLFPSRTAARRPQPVVAEGGRGRRLDTAETISSPTRPSRRPVRNRVRSTDAHLD